jgi:bla regulator protein BlaR1
MSIDVINHLSDLWLKPGVILACILVLIRWSPARSPASSHWLLVTLGLIIFALIPASFYLPRLELSILPSSYQFIELNHGSDKTDLLINNLAFYAILAAYLLPATFLLFSYSFDFLDARTMVKGARPISLQENLIQKFELLRGENAIDIRASDKTYSPVLWGASSPVIVLPESFVDWSAARLERVIAHELAHVSRRDWLFRNINFIVCALFWLVPGVWAWMHRSNLYAEFACDDYVVKRLDCRAEYASDLLALAKGTGSIQAAPAFSEQRHLYQRLSQVLDGARDRDQSALWLRLWALSFALLCILPLFSLKFVKSVDRAETLPPIRFEWTQVAQNLAGPKKHENSTVFELPPVHDAPALRIEESLIVEAPSWEISSQTPQASIEASETFSSIEMRGFVAIDMQVPEYPRHYLQRGVEAEVIATFDINQRGAPENIRLEMHPKRKAFMRSVEKALKNSRFRPVEINGQAVRLKNVQEHYIFQIDAG